MHVMIIDDSRAMRRILHQIVKPQGWRISEAGNGREAWEFIQNNPDVELALVDWNMPEMNGIEFIELVRNDDRFLDTRLVMVTTETEPAQMAKALLSGVDEFVMKPFTADGLLEKLALIGVPVNTNAA